MHEILAHFNQLLGIQANSTTTNVVVLIAFIFLIAMLATGGGTRR